MTIRLKDKRDGVALIIVLIAVLVLAALAGGFAYSMKVEMKLARNSTSEVELEWLGRSGVEMARWILAQSASCPADCLNQRWAGGPGGYCETNGPLMNVSLENNELGSGRFSIKITDLERKLNANMVRNYQGVFEQALAKLGFENAPSVVACITDWTDRDDLTSVGGGAENNYYHGLTPPYDCKNGPMDDLSELLLVRGITPDMYWGSASTNYRPPGFMGQTDAFGRSLEPVYPVGLADIFTALSTGKINVNTAPQSTLSLVLDDNAAAEIIRLRSGYDGADGTEDDTPAGGQLMNLYSMLRGAGLNDAVARQMQNLFVTRSSTFEVQVDAEISGYKRTFIAVLGRNNPRDIQILKFYWK